MKNIFITIMLLAVVIMLLILSDGCVGSLFKHEQKQPAAKTEATFVQGGGEGNQTLRYVLSKTNYLFFVLVLVAVAGVIMALSLKMTQGWGIAVAGIAGAVFCVTIAKYGALVGILAVAGIFIYLIFKLSLFKKIGDYAITYAEGVKKLADENKVKEFNANVYQPKKVREYIAQQKVIK